MNTQVQFMKYEACGNDYILIDELSETIIDQSHRQAVAMSMMDRHFGIGADGVAYITSSPGCDGMMRLVDSPTGEAFMCGNGIRCVAHYLWVKTGKHRLRIDTRSGVKETVSSGGINPYFRVNMGRLYRHGADVEEFLPQAIPPDQCTLDLQLDLPGLGKIELSVVHIGEPHAVMFVDDIAAMDIALYGALITKSRDVFPRKMNLNLVQVLSRDTVRLRTFEAGVEYETLSCGTGCASSAAVACLTGRVAPGTVQVMTKGGQLHIDIAGEDLYMSGPVRPVFAGKTTVTMEGEQASLYAPVT